MRWCRSQGAPSAPGAGPLSKALCLPDSVGCWLFLSPREGAAGAGSPLRLLPAGRVIPAPPWPLSSTPAEATTVPVRRGPLASIGLSQPLCLGSSNCHCPRENNIPVISIDYWPNKCLSHPERVPRAWHAPKRWPPRPRGAGRLAAACRPSPVAQALLCGCSVPALAPEAVTWLKSEPGHGPLCSTPAAPSRGHGRAPPGPQPARAPAPAFPVLSLTLSPRSWTGHGGLPPRGLRACCALCRGWFPRTPMGFASPRLCSDGGLCARPAGPAPPPCTARRRLAWAGSVFYVPPPRGPWGARLFCSLLHPPHLRPRLAPNRCS